MATALLILSDTHVPNRARTLPDHLWAEVESADIVLHAGDWMSVDFYSEVEARSQRLIGVWGNNDGDELRNLMPEVARETIEGLTFAMTHETGAAMGREARCDLSFPNTDVLVFGHSHIPWQTVTPRGMRLLNPGSPTDRRRQPRFSYMSATASAGTLDVQLHTFGP